MSDAQSGGYPKIARDLDQELQAIRQQQAAASAAKTYSPGLAPRPVPPSQAVPAYPSQSGPAGIASGAPNDGEFERLAESVCKGLFYMLVDKNRASRGSLMEPMRVFSRAPLDEQLNMRIDDRLAAIANNDDWASLADVAGEIILKLMVKQKAVNGGRTG